jgi:hypothetical protein
MPAAMHLDALYTMHAILLHLDRILKLLLLLRNTACSCSCTPARDDKQCTAVRHVEPRRP